ncbi:DUF4136 domain-containing protein [Polaromonas aquatica]|uniref:DUF4136 domain-containing protein n=1 Tax=Polaromonas aquatica TaxID=332657 RepID=UPI003D65E512
MYPFLMTRFMPFCLSLRSWLALAVVALLTACASPITTRVTSFNQWPADAAGSTFSYITPVDTTRQLEQATYEGHVQAELEKRGLRLAPPGQVGRLQVDVAASSRSEEKTWMQPVYQDNMVFVPPYRDAAGRLYGGGWVPDPFGPRYVGDRPVSMTLYTHSLRLRLLDTQGTPPGKPPRTVFESRAFYEGGSSDLPLVVPYLVRAVFDDFPGQNGQVRVVKFDSKTGALIKK